MYRVDLYNGCGCFDSFSGFDSIDEALDWASGRSGGYIVYIELVDAPSSLVALWATDLGKNTVFHRQHDYGRHPLTVEQIAAMFRSEAPHDPKRHPRRVQQAQIHP